MYAQPRAVPAAAAVTMLEANPTRVAILAYLARHPDATRVDICNKLGIGQQTFRIHINQLINLGYVHTNPPAHTGLKGRRVSYQVNTRAVARELARLTRELTPPPQ